ncbi:MAG: hypothetical protein K0R85_258 [Devosia sp.]|jgi:hypothetical protein|nr:hypothetical protein [Devosia sp.]
MTKETATDLSAFDGLAQAQEDGIDVPITHPSTGDELGIVIRVAGPDSSRQRKAVQKQIDARLRRRSTQPMTAEEITESSLRTLAHSVISWNSVVIDGADVPCTYENAIALFQRFPFIREQVDSAAGNRAGFLQK